MCFYAVYAFCLFDSFNNPSNREPYNWQLYEKWQTTHCNNYNWLVISSNQIGNTISRINHINFSKRTTDYTYFNFATNPLSILNIFFPQKKIILINKEVRLMFQGNFNSKPTITTLWINWHINEIFWENEKRWETYRRV